MLLAVNWRSWQAEKNPRVRMKFQGRLKQASFIEIQQVYAKKKVWYFSNRVVAYLFDIFIRMIWGRGD